MWQRIIVFISIVLLAIVGIYFISETFVMSDMIEYTSGSDISNYSREDFYTEYLDMVIENSELDEVSPEGDSIMENNIGNDVVYNTTPINEEFVTFVTNGDLDFSSVGSIINTDKQEALRAVYYTLHNAGCTNVVIAGIMGSVCREGNVGQFEIIGQNDTGGYLSYKANTKNPVYYNLFPDKDGNPDGIYEYANSYSGKVPWGIQNFTCAEFKTMLNVGVDDSVMMYGVGVTQSTDPSKHSEYINVVDNFCTQSSISLNTVIDKELMLQLEVNYVKTRAMTIMPDADTYRRDGPFMRLASSRVKHSIIESAMMERSLSTEPADVRMAATYWFVEEEACGGAKVDETITRVGYALKCYEVLQNYDASRSNL